MRLLYILLVVLLASCSSKPQVGVSELNINLKDAQTIIMDTNKIVSLETNDSSLLYDICGLYELDNKYFIWSRSMIKVFDKKGKYLYNVSGKGQGPDEYVSLFCVFAKDNNVCAYDLDRGILLSFNPEGRLKKSQHIVVADGSPSPANIIPFGKDHYLCINRFRGGNNVQTPAISIWNSDFTKQDTVTGRLLENGFMIADWLHADVDGNQILYWEPMKDTLFTVKDKRVSSMYAINFGDYSIPAEEATKDVYDRIMYFNKSEIASLCRFYQIDGDYIYFIFSWAGRAYLCRFKQDNPEPEVYEFKDERYKTMPFFKIIGEQILIAVEDKEDVEKNCGLLVVDKKTLDKNR